MRYFLTRVKIEGFRGVNNETEPLEIKFDKEKVNSLFAPNGTGKSSIYDAIYFAITGSLPKLDILHQVERGSEYYVNRFHGQSTATIELEFETDEATPTTHTVKVIRNADGSKQVTSPSAHPDPQSLLNELNQSFTLLDYHTFNKFIDHSPLDRGRSFSTLLGLDIYSDFRQTLKTAIDTRALKADLGLDVLESQVTTHTATSNTALTRMDTAYSALIGESITDIGKLDDNEAKVLAVLSVIELVKPVVSGKQLGEVDFSEIKTAIKTAEEGKNQEKLAGLTATLTKLNALGNANANEINPEIEKLQGLIPDATKLLEATAGAARKQLYLAADHLITSGGWHDENKCPLCSSDLSSPIASIVSQQKEQYAQFEAKVLEIKTAWSSSALRTRLTTLENTIGADIPDVEKSLADVSKKLDEGTCKAEDFKALIDYYSKLEARLATAIKTYTDKKIELEKKIPPSLVQLTEQIENARQFREYLKDYRDSQAKVKTAQDKLSVRTRWQAFVTSGASAFANAEANLSKEKLAAIEDDYKEMFASIMTASDVVPNLQRDSSREDLYVQLSDFHGQHNVSAKPLLSESYRNALAISVYLSAALKHTGAPRFIVLDDITSSFDAYNQLNLVEYIRTKLRYGANQDGIQFIILSHDSIIQKYFENLSGNDGVKHQVLEGRPPGSLTTRGQSADWIRQTALTQLNAGQVETGAPWVRRYLECILMQVIRKLKITVPLDFAVKNHTRMVANCLEAITNAIDLHELANDLVLDATQRQEARNTHVPAIVGNFVSHYETGSGASVTPNMLIGVITSVDNFADCFKYDFTPPNSVVVERRWYKSLNSRQ